MPGNNPSSCGPLDALQPLGAVEPSWVISSQPALRDTVTPLTQNQYQWLSLDQHLQSTYVFNDVTVVANEEECPAVGQIELHSDQS